MSKKSKAYIQLPTNRDKKRHWVIRIISSIWFWLAITLALISSLLDVPAAYHKYFTPEREQIHNQKFITGVLLPKDLNPSLPVNIKLGINSQVTFSYSINQLIAGTELRSYVACDVMTHPEMPLQLGIKIMNNRIYVTDTITYLENDEVIGIIDKNAWFLFNDNVLDYFPSDNFLEVIDRQNHVALSLCFINSNTVLLQGYWNNRNNVNVAGNSFMPCISKEDPDYKKTAINEIIKIKPLRLSPFSKDGLLK